LFWRLHLISNLANLEAKVPKIMIRGFSAREVSDVTHEHAQEFFRRIVAPVVFYRVGPPTTKAVAEVPVEPLHRSLDILTGEGLASEVLLHH